MSETTTRPKAARVRRPQPAKLKYSITEIFLGDNDRAAENLARVLISWNPALSASKEAK